MAERREQLPARVGPFEILGVLGEGGMGVVYCGRLPGSANRVAVKTVPVAQEGLLSSMRRELHALGRLAHPGVVRVLMSGVDGGRPWYGVILMSLRAVNELETAAPPIRFAAPYVWLGYAAGLARLPGLARSYFAEAREAARKTGDTAGGHSVW